jgi:hypothetical protein
MPHDHGITHDLTASGHFGLPKRSHFVPTFLTQASEHDLWFWHRRPSIQEATRARHTHSINLTAAMVGSPRKRAPSLGPAAALSRTLNIAAAGKPVDPQEPPGRVQQDLRRWLQAGQRMTDDAHASLIASSNRHNAAINNTHQEIKKISKGTECLSHPFSRSADRGDAE